MKRKIIFLPAVYSKEIVDNINIYFDKGYEIENILNADSGNYLILVLKGNEKCYYEYSKKIDLPDDKYNIIEESNSSKKWTVDNTKEVKFL